MNLLNNIVKQMLEEHKGGEKFFDNLDANLQNSFILDEFWRKCLRKYDRVDVEFIVTGKFGIFINNYFSMFSPVIIRGGLRKSPSMLGELEYLRKRLSGIDCVLIDDSFYSGRTRDAIKKEVERIGGRLIHTCVIYDGSMKKDPNVTSMYRYYDHVDKEYSCMITPFGEVGY